MVEHNDELPFRAGTPVSAQNVNPQLLQDMIVALTNLQLQLADRQLAPAPRDPRVPDVPMCDGNIKKYSVFLSRLQNFFSLQPSTYNTDAKKIGYVICRLDGIAADWATTILGNVHLGNNSRLLSDWNFFLSVFARFSDPEAQQNATDSLLSLAQGKTQSVLGYWTKFSDLLYRSEFSPDSARPLFERGLRLDIRDRLADKVLPTDLDGFVQAAIELDNRLFRLRRDKRSGFGNADSGYSKQSFSATQPQSSSGVAPMDIGAMQTYGGSMDSKERLDQIRGMEPDQRKRVCFEENRCHYCKRVVGSPPVHLAQNCPLKLNKSKSDYSCVFPEVQPQKGILDYSERVPQRQVFSFAHSNMHFKKDVSLSTNQGVFKTKALIDSGAMGFAYIDLEFVKRNGINVIPLKDFIEVKTVDGSPCGNGKITHKCIALLEIAEWKQEVELFVISSPSVPVILGWNWLKAVNPIIDWKNETIDFDSGTPDGKEGVPQRQVFVDLISMAMLSRRDSVQLDTLLEKYDGVFATREFPELAPHRTGIDINLELIDGKSPPFGPIYSLSQ